MHGAACLTISTVDVILSISVIPPNLRRRERVKFYYKQARLNIAPASSLVSHDLPAKRISRGREANQAASKQIFRTLKHNNNNNPPNPTRRNSQAREHRLDTLSREHQWNILREFCMAPTGVYHRLSNYIRGTPGTCIPCLRYVALLFDGDEPLCGA